MKISIHSLIQKLYNNKNLEHIEKLFDLYEKLQEAQEVSHLFEELSNWFKDEYKVNNTKLVLHDIERDVKEVIFHKGKEFDYETDKLVFSFTISIHPYMKAIYSFAADSEEHYPHIKNEYTFIEFLFYEISVVIKNSIIQKELKEASLRDSVTGVYNRKFLTEHLSNLIPLARREKYNIGFLTVGIDHFKAVIDEFDYHIGDKVLIELAKTLHQNVRESDIVVRLDGDEFLVVLANTKDHESTKMIAKKLIDKFSKCEIDVNLYSGQKLKKTICIGISMYPKDSTSVDQLLKNADIALYEAKNKGRSQVLSFNKEQEGSIDLF